MLTSQTQDAWDLFLEFIEERCSSTEFENWISPIRLLDSDTNKVILEVPNIFVQQYLIDNYKKDLVQFLPTLSSGEPAIEFVIAEAKKNICSDICTVYRRTCDHRTYERAPRTKIKSILYF